MEKIKGQNLRITLGGLFVGFATSCTLHISMTLEDSSTKDSTGSWQEQELTGKAWDISCDALYSTGENDANGVSGEGALDLILAGEEVEVEFVAASGDKNRVIQAGKKYTGKAIINDISIQAQNRQNTTYTIQAQGNGELKSETAVAAS